VPGFAIVRQVQVTVRLEEADVDALSELREWLLEADGVRRYARLRWADTTESGATGVGLDALQLVVGGGFSVRQLVVAIGQWQDSRDAGMKVLVSRRAEDGIAVLISALDPHALEDAITALEGG
jgi:Effector Associated Constant Component 1